MPAKIACSLLFALAVLCASSCDGTGGSNCKAPELDGEAMSLIQTEARLRHAEAAHGEKAQRHYQKRGEAAGQHSRAAAAKEAHLEMAQQRHRQKQEEAAAQHQKADGRRATTTVSPTKEEVWGSPFIDPSDINNTQLFIVTCLYAYVLVTASGLISDGSEYLLLIPSVAGVVGSIVLPVLGAVPDGMMVLFSALGPDAQSQVSVGVGALAGSTIMLLTLPWFIALFYGRVPLDENGNPDYSRREEDAPFFSSGIKPLDDIPRGARIMIATSFIYFVIQIPATLNGGDSTTHPTESTTTQATHEHTVALIAFFVAFVAFLLYLWKMYSMAQEGEGNLQDKMQTAIVGGMKRGTINLSAVLDFERKFVTEGQVMSYDALPDEDKQFMKMISKPFFNSYDEDKSGTIDPSEFKRLLSDLGEKVDKDTAEKIFKEADRDRSGTVNFEEFQKMIFSYVADPVKSSRLAGGGSGQKIAKLRKEAQATDDDDDDEGPELPEDWASLPKEEQQKKVLMRSLWMMGLGTILVLTFSDPAVQVLDEIGTRLNVSSFYVSFLLAPMASNASELIAAKNYASRKTAKAMTTSLQTLEGAACMNNTFCTAIFFFVIWLQHIAWQFTAETISIVLIQWIIGAIALFKTKQTMWDAILIISCYPGALIIVYALEKWCGLD